MDSVVDSLTHTVMILDTTLRLLIPPEVCKMTPRLRQIYGCEICIIPKDIHIDLNILRTKLVSDLQHWYVGRLIKWL